jgi:hypothetical protein
MPLVAENFQIIPKKGVDGMVDEEEDDELPRELHMQTKITEGMAQNAIVTLPTPMASSSSNHQMSTMKTS